MREIPLTRGQFTIVDDDDYEELVKYKWQANWSDKTKSFYVVRGVIACEFNNTNQTRMHRQIMNPDSKMVVDHINHNTLDNRKCNLRVVTSSQNQMNKIIQSNNKSGVTGVSWNKRANKWRAQINLNRRNVYIGQYLNKKDAIKARKEAEQKYFGEYAYKTNKPD